MSSASLHGGFPQRFPPKYKPASTVTITHLLKKRDNYSPHHQPLGPWISWPRGRGHSRKAPDETPVEQKEHGLQEPSPAIHWLGYSELTTYQCISVSLPVEWGSTGPTTQQSGTRGQVKRLVGSSSQAEAGGRREEALGTATAPERMVGEAQEHVMIFDICSVQLSHLAL